MKFNVYKARVGLILPALTSLADRSERVFLVALQQWMDFAHKQIRHDLTEKYIKKDVTTELTDWEFIEEQGREILKPTTLKIMQSGGNQAYRILQAQVSFDVLNTGAVKAADKFCGKLVREVTGETKKGIRGYIKAGVKEGKAMNKIARELKPLVGLTQRQAESISNYRNWLNEKRPELSATQVDKRVTTYANKTHRRRMQTIARTETARAQNIGYAVGLEDLGIEQVEFQISATDYCDECEGLNETKFKVREGGGIIPVHPNCRCCLLPVVADTPACRLVKGIEKADCIPPNDLHDKQIADLLKRLEAPKTSAEGRKIRKALRRLGHRGGLGGKPPVTTPPAVKPTVPVTVKPKPIIPKPTTPKPVPGATKFETAEDYRKALLDLAAGKIDPVEQAALKRIVAERTTLHKKAFDMQRTRWDIRKIPGNEAKVNELWAAEKTLDKQVSSLYKREAALRAKQKVSLQEMRAVLNETDNMAGAVKGAAGKWESVADDILSWIPKNKLDDFEQSAIKYLNTYKEGKRFNLSGQYSRDGHSIMMYTHTKKVFAHEFGHHLSYQIKGAYRAQSTFFKARTAGEIRKKLQGFVDIYGKKNKFSRYTKYAGRIYKDGTIPECISVGIEYVWKNPLAAARKDPEWFNMVMSALKKFTI